jgi:hypothetical protein
MPSTAISCADTSFLNASISGLQTTFHNLSTFSFANFYMNVELECDILFITPTYPTLPLFVGDTPINASLSLLSISKTFDPITPLRNGIAMLKLPPTQH